MDPWSRKPFPLHQIHFLAGVKGSGTVGLLRPRYLFHFPPGINEHVGPIKILPSIPFQAVVPQRAFMRYTVLIVLKDELNNVPTLPIDHVRGAGFRHRTRARILRRSPMQVSKWALWLPPAGARSRPFGLPTAIAHVASSGGPIFIQYNDNLKSGCHHGGSCQVVSFDCRSDCGLGRAFPPQAQVPLEFDIFTHDVQEQVSMARHAPIVFGGNPNPAPRLGAPEDRQASITLAARLLHVLS